jgi:membrane-bound ClpP family serine protease
MSYSDDLQTLWAEIKNHLELQKQYLLMDTAEKLTVLLSAVAIAVICLTLGAMALFFMLFAIAAWIGQIAGNAFLGFLIMGALLLLLMMIAYAGRKRWIIQPLSRLVVGLFLQEEEGKEAEV